MSEINENTQESIDEGIPEVSFTVQVAEEVATPVDDTLSISGMAADAAATGQAIEDAKGELQDQIDDLEDDITAVAGTMFPVGSVYISTSDSAPTFGEANWNWQEILIPVKQDDLVNGSRSYANVGSGDVPGTLHFWLRIADTEASA